MKVNARRRRNGLVAPMLSALMGLGVLLTGAMPAMASSTNLTVAEYQEFLATEDPEVLDQFLALNSTDQQKLVETLANPELYGDSPESIDGVEVNEVAGQTPSGGMTINATIDRYAWTTRSVSFLGVKILEYKIEIGYKCPSTSSISQINYHNAWVTRNYNPLVKTGVTYNNAWISGATAHQSAAFYYDIGPLKGLSVQIMTLYGKLEGYAGGGHWYEWWGDL